MLVVTMLLLGLLIGAGVGWLLSSSKYKKSLFDYRLDAEGRLKSAESATTELRNKLSELKTASDFKDRELSEIQSQLKGEAEQKAAAVAELREVRSALHDASVVRDQLNIEASLRVAAETKLKESQAHLEEQKKLLDEATARLTDTFNALSAQALKSNNETFLQIATRTFETLQAQSKGDLETRQKAIDGLVNPLKETLHRYEMQIQEMEKARQNAYGGLDEQLRTLAVANQQLQRETGSLVTALRAPQVRGRWGEMTLRRAAELAGMSEHCDFTEQETLSGDDVRQRPDMIVNLPGGRRIAVDAKVPLQAFLDAVSATTQEARDSSLSRHSQLVRHHMTQLASRGYWEQFSQAPELVVLFLPGESFFAAAVEQDRTIIEDGMERRVVLSTPTTLVALLRAIAYGWRQEQLAKNAEEISELGKQLHDRIRTFISHFDGLGSSLKRSVESFNRARASLESRVLPSARKFKELKAATGEDIPEVEPVDEVPGTLASSETPEVS